MCHKTFSSQNTPNIKLDRIQDYDSFDAQAAALVISSSQRFHARPHPAFQAELPGREGIPTVYTRGLASAEIFAYQQNRISCARPLGVCIYLKIGQKNVVTPPTLNLSSKSQTPFRLARYLCCRIQHYHCMACAISSMSSGSQITGGRQGNQRCHI